MVAGFSLYVVRMMETIERQNGQLVALKNELDRKEEIISLLAADNVGIVVMDGANPNAPARGKLICDPAHRTALLHVSHLPIPPVEMEYRLWAVRGADTVSVFQFTMPDTTDCWFKIGRLPFDAPGGITAFTVTIEPKGGGTTPTGAVHLSGSLKR